jgi:hypothetical protein
MKDSPKMYGNGAQLAAYVSPAVWERVKRITRDNPRLSISELVGECVESWLPKIEKRLGLNGHK